MSELSDEDLIANSLFEIKKLKRTLALQKEPIAIIGMSCRFPGGANGVEDFWEILKGGRDCITIVPNERWDIDEYYDADPLEQGKMVTKYGGFLETPVDRFDAEFFKISHKEAEYLDPQQRLILEVIWEAIENAGIPPHTLSGSKTGVFVGICSSDYHDLILESGDKKNITAYWATGSAHSTATGRISFLLDLKGPNFAVDTACSSSLVAVDSACGSLHNGSSDLAIAGGVNLILSPDLTIDFSQAGMLAPDGHCKTFDEKADGYVRGEGCGIVVLKRLSDAKRDGDQILAVIRASGINQDGSSSGLTVPNGEAQIDLIEEVVKKANINKEDVDYIEAHGTGTSLGDPIEVRALSETYGKRSKEHPLYLGSVKTNIGHTEGAAGIAGLIKAVLVLQKEEIPPHLNFKTLNPQIDWNFPGEIVTENKPWKRGKRKRLAAISSFGFSGTNAHVIIEEAPAPKEVIPEIKERPLQILTLSAKSEKALNELALRYREFLRSKEVKLEDLVFTANVCRSHFQHRLAIICDSLDQLKEKLQKKDFVLAVGEEYENVTVHFNFVDTGREIIYPIESHVVKVDIGPETDWMSLYENICNFYVNGANVDWKGLELPNLSVRKKISLPTYPFQKQRFWVDSALKKIEPPWQTPGMHPLLGRQLTFAGVEARFFEAHISPEWPDFMQDHKIYDHVVVAGASYLSSVLSAIYRLQIGSAAIEEVEFIQPVVLQKNEQLSLQTVFQPIENGEFEFTITSQILKEGEEDEWIDHVKGYVRSGRDRKETSNFSIQDIQSHCENSIEGDQIYQQARSLGLNLNNHFQWIEKVYFGENEYLGKMRPPLGNEEGEGYILHPGFLDACLQTAMAKPIFENQLHVVRVPVSIDCLWYDSDGQNPTWVYGKFRKEDQANILDLTLLSSTGACLGVIEGVYTLEAPKEVLERSIVKSKTISDWFYEWTWEVKDLEESAIPEETGKWALVGDVDAVGKNIHCQEIAFDSKESLRLELEKIENLAGIICTYKDDPLREHFEDIKTVVLVAQTVIEMEQNLSLFLVSAAGLFQSPLYAIQKTVLEEHPEQIITSIRGTPEEVARELIAHDGEEFVIYSQGKRMVGRLLRESKVRAKRQELTRPVDDQFRLKSKEKGLLENLELASLEAFGPLREHQVEVEVHAVGLNFRDVLDALGLYPGDPGPMGGDGAGIVSAVGEGVKSVLVGDLVFGLMPGSLARRCVAQEDTIAKIGNTLSLKDAAALPTVFLTAHLALNHLGKMQPGEKVLIHAGAGGVGQAAIQLAKNAALEVFATAGNDKKRQFLKDQGVDHVLDSRSLEYGKEIESLTNGEGVDIVLNCLSGEGFIETTVSQCKKGARFLEIGKRDIWSKEKMQKARPDIDYQIIALDDISQKEPHRIQLLLNELIPLFDSGQLKPLPLTEFPIEHAIEAFSYMREAKQIGKIVITIPTKDELKPQFKKDASYLITGGLGGLGLTLGKWLSDNGAGTIILTGRSGLKEEARKAIADIRAKGTNVIVQIGDVGVKEDVTRIVKEAKSLKGIFHLAGVLDDAPFLSLKWEHFEKTFAPKVYGSLFLHQITQEIGVDLDYFVMFSSIAATLGSPGQGNYAVANAYMDSLAHYRRSKNLPAQSLAWGSWSQIGMAAGLVSQHTKFGILPIAPFEGMQAFEEALLLNSANISIMSLNWNRYLKSRIKIPLWLSDFSKGIKVEGIYEKLTGLDPAEQANYLKTYIITVVKDVLGLSQSQQLDEKKGFFDMGLDSLMAVELKNRLQAAIGPATTLSTTFIFDFPTVEKLNDHLAQLLKLKEKKLRTKEPVKMIDRQEPIAIIGMSCRFPGGIEGIEDFWRILEDGKDCISKVPEQRWDVEEYYDPDPSTPGKMVTKYGGFLAKPIDQFDTEFFGISPIEAEYLDPQQRLMLEVIWEALENAGIQTSSIAGSKTGVFIGLCSSDYHNLILQSGNKENITAYFATGTAHSTATGRISFVLDLKGPNFAVDTACSSSLVAVDSAFNSLLLGTSDLAIAGGVNLILSPDLTIDFSQAGMLAPDGHCKTFDEKADGYVRGEGCGVVVLKRLSDAIKDGDPLLAVIRASGINQDGSSSGLTVPNGESQIELIEDVIHKAGIKPEDVDYIEAHGTGTALGDPIEVRALGSTYGLRNKEHPLYLGSVKTNIGHTEGAAGVAGLIKAVLSLNHELLPPHLHFNTLNPEIQWNFPGEIVTEAKPWKRGERRRFAGISSFGFSGTNSHIIIEEGPLIEKETVDDERPFHILTLSAKSKGALDQTIVRYQEYLKSTKESLPDIAYTANTGREHFKYRIGVIAKDVDEMKKKLDKADYLRGKGGQLIDVRFEFVESGGSIRSQENLFTIGPKTDWEKLFIEVAKLYVDGADIDWKGLEAPYPRQKVLLPNYPFQRRRFWAKSIIAGDISRKVMIHPLLGTRINLSSGEVLYTNTLSDKAFEYLSDCKREKLNVFPVAGFLEMILSAAKNISNQEFLRVSGIKIYSALVITHKATEIEIMTKTINEKSVELKINGKTPDKWEIFSEATLDLSHTFKEQEKLNPDQFYDSAWKDIEVDRLYKSLESKKYHYDKSFKTVVSAKRKNGFYFFELETGEDTYRYTYHPTLLDACLNYLLYGKVQAGVEIDDNLQLEIDEVIVYGSSGDTINVLCKEDHDSSGAKCSNILLLNQVFKVIGQIKGIKILKKEC